MIMEAALPFVETKQQSEFKKVVIGLVCTFALEIIFFLLAAISIAVLWFLVFHCTGTNDHQTTYIYNPYEVKYFVITVGGIRKRVAVKRYLQKKKIIITQ